MNLSEKEPENLYKIPELVVESRSCGKYEIRIE
jgi:hypothetical protein